MTGYCKLLLTCPSPGFMHLCKARVWEGLINRGGLITEGGRKSNSSSACHTFCIYRLLLKLQSIITYPFHSKQARGGLTKRCIFWLHVEEHEKGQFMVVSLFRIQATETSLEYKHNFLQCKRTCRRTSWSSLIFERVENNTFLITSLASCKYSLLRAGLNWLAPPVVGGEPGSLPSVDDIDTIDWFTFGDSETLSDLLNLKVKATNHLRTESLALIILCSASLPALLLLFRGTCAAEREIVTK